MLQNLKELYGKKLAASDGEIGQVKDFYFDDKTWVVRYVVADTGSWLSGRLVLLSPHVFGRLDQTGDSLRVNLTRKQIEGSPPIEAHRSVSRQYEIEYYRYYGWPTYWDGAGLWGVSGYPLVAPAAKAERELQLQHHHRDDKHLQSTHSVTGYHLQTPEGTIGHVSGFLIDEKSWAIRQLVGECGHWYAHQEILISPAAVEKISFEDSKVLVGLTQSEIRQTAESDLAKTSAGSQGAGNVYD